jgi:hypothetical protein
LLPQWASLKMQEQKVAIATTSNAEKEIQIQKNPVSL